MPFGGLRRRPAGIACAAILLALASLLLVVRGAGAQEPIPVPKLTARVIDQTGTLTANERAALEEKLRAFEQARGSQIAVLVVPTLGTETIEEFAGRVTDEWQLGRKGVDDGVLLVVARQERALRIHTGRGVQGTLTDALSKRIVADIIAPHFRSGDFAAGLNAGVEAIVMAVEGEQLPLPEPRPAGARADGPAAWSNFVVLAFFLVPILGMVLRGIFGRFFGASATSGLAAVAAWIVLGSVFAAVVAAFFVFAFTLASGSGIARTARRGGWAGGHLPGGGTWGGGWGGGGGFGGGGFGGGGGGFDGGGASGRW